MPGPVPRIADELPPLQAEGPYGQTDAPRLRWHRTLVWFMRIVAILWIIKGLGAWATILGLSSSPIAFEGASRGFQASVIYFAIMDLMAAVGLWLAASWGGILWLLAVMSHMILAVFFPRFVSNATVLLGLFIASIMIYLVISWLASIEEH